jgi:dTDP-4-amino-4,6-dideoxygalactose transaminase
MSIYKVPHFGLARQYANLKEELLEATDLAMRDGILVGGEFTAKFEEWLRKRTGCKYATVTHSGTQALEFIAQYASYQDFLNGNEGNPVISVPNITYPATLNAFINNGWRVIIEDTDKWGIMLHDTNDWYGNYACHVGLYGAAGRTFQYHHPNVIVDGAQHWLAGGDNVGIGMAISFDPTKNLPASGNGGAVVTHNKALYDYVNLVKDNGKPNHDYPGTNSKMSEIDCAHLLVRTKYIDTWQQARKNIRRQYINEFRDLPIRCLSKDFMLHADQKFVIYTENRDALYAYLLENGIEAKIHYKKTLSELPIANDHRILSKPDMLSTSVHLVRGLLSLPIYPELTANEIEYVINKVKSFYAQNGHN